MTIANCKVGKKVTFTSAHITEKGIISSISGNNVFVVYNCNNDWENYQDYTGALTPASALTEGW